MGRPASWSHQGEPVFRVKGTLSGPELLGARVTRGWSLGQGGLPLIPAGGLGREVDGGSFLLKLSSFPTERMHGLQNHKYALKGENKDI